jgi:TRAP transporter 4TM/12TM fusion protein
MAPQDEAGDRFSIGVQEAHRMTAVQVTPDAPPPIVVDESELPPGTGEGFSGRVLYLFLVFTAIFHVVVAAYPILPSQVIRAMHVALLCLAAEGLYGNLRARAPLLRIAAWALGLLALLPGIYQWVEYNGIILRSGDPNEWDLAAGALAIATLFLITWRILGGGLPLLCAIFLAYGLFGQYLPPPLDHRGYDLAQIIDHLTLGTEGIYGLPTYVSATYIFLFVLFASFLERAGMIALFNDIALGVVGHARGGPAKVANISSALMGTISGSGIANVVASGQFTIPLMKRFGFSASFAGAVEATSSMGGQIMPPVMGAAAFIMAETLGIPYSDVVWAAIIPAALYFLTCHVMIDLEARKYGLAGLPKDECPSAIAALRRDWPLTIPLGVLVYVLFAGYTPLLAGVLGLALTVFLILGKPIAERIPIFALRVVFWVVIGLASAAFFDYGVATIGLVLLVLVALSLLFAAGRLTVASCIDGLVEGTRNAVAVGLACAIVGIVVGVLTLTGVASIFGNWVVAIGRDSLFLSLLLTMLLCLVLGTGIPTVPNYIITASLAGPALLELGVPLLVTHMFCFYFGIMADLTPPVALAAFAAAPLAKASGTKIAWQATRLAVAGYVVPFMAVYTPVLMLQNEGPLVGTIGFWPAAAYVTLKAVLAIWLWGMAVVGYFRTRLAPWERLWAFAAAAMLILALPWTDEVGFAACIAYLAWHLLRTRGHRPERTVARGMAGE